MPRFYSFVVTVIKPLTLSLLILTLRVITGRPTNYVESALAEAFRNVAMKFLDGMALPTTESSAT